MTYKSVLRIVNSKKMISKDLKLTDKIDEALNVSGFDEDAMNELLDKVKHFLNKFEYFEYVLEKIK